MSVSASMRKVATLVSSPLGTHAPGPERDHVERMLVDRLKSACDGFLALEHQQGNSPLERLHATAAGLHTFAASVLACEQAGLDRSAIVPYVSTLRELHAQSPFVRRLQTWPRGYAGDFETVEWLCDADNRAPFGTMGWAIEQYALQSPVAQQHRNKVTLLAKAMLEVMLQRPRARVTSIGCGGCRDLSLIQDFLHRTDVTFVLVDADADALAFARRRLGAAAGRCEFVHGRVPRALASIASHGPFDLIVAGGLFDYLPDRWAVATLRAARRILTPGGRLVLSNIAAGNPFRVWLEYLAEWRLIERHEADLTRLLGEGGFVDATARLTRDSTGLALIVDTEVAG